MPGCHGEPVYVFTNIDDDALIALNTGDAGTTQAPKRVINNGISTIGITVNKAEEIANASAMNEVSFYRRHRNSSRIKNQNLGGKKIPDFVIPGRGGLSKDDIEYMKKFDIAKLQFHERELEIDKEKEGTER